MEAQWVKTQWIHITEYDAAIFFESREMEKKPQCITLGEKHRIENYICIMILSK